MVTFSIFGFLWRFLLIVVGAFLLYCIVSYPFQRRWLTARLRVDEWLKGQFFRSGKSTPPGFAPVGEAARPLARSLDKLVKNYRNTSNAKAMKGLREDAREIVISIVESVTEIFEHWKIL